MFYERQQGEVPYIRSNADMGRRGLERYMDGYKMTSESATADARFIESNFIITISGGITKIAQDVGVRLITGTATLQVNKDGSYTFSANHDDGSSYQSTGSNVSNFEKDNKEYLKTDRNLNVIKKDGI